jgi:hypothetical protein
MLTAELPQAPQKAMRVFKCDEGQVTYSSVKAVMVLHSLGSVPLKSST